MSGLARTRLWIDTDIGDDPDDAVALALAARHPAAEVVGVSTVDGDVNARAREARALLQEFECDAPVIAGAPPSAALHDAGADALLAIGPLTNVARLVAEHAALPSRVVVMGGALAVVQHRGVAIRIEHNFGRDPAAAGVVVDACETCTIVPLDVTARCCLDASHEAALRATATSLDDAIARWQRERAAPVCLHDPLALLVLLGDAPVRHELRRVRVDVDGAIVSDTDDAVNDRDVVVEVDAAAAIDRVMRIVGATVR